MALFFFFQKFKELALKLGHGNFVPTDGWLTRWKKRNNIVFKRVHGEKATADHQSASAFKNKQIPSLWESFNAENILNADETGLYYRATPASSLIYKHETVTGSKKTMDRITILCCANIAETAKKSWS